MSRFTENGVARAACAAGGAPPPEGGARGPADQAGTAAGAAAVDEAGAVGASAGGEEASPGEEDDLDLDDFDNEEILQSLLAGPMGDDEDILGDGTLMKSIISPAPRFTRRPQLGDEVTVHFVGTLEDGKVFDDSRSRGEPFTFRVGLEQVIKGWDKGVPTMMLGERALFTMAAELAYGEEGAGWKIPKNATVRFDVELLGFEELDDMSGEFDDPEDLDYAYVEEEGCGRDDIGPGGQDPAGRYTWTRHGQEVIVELPLAEGVRSQDVVGEFRPQRVRVSVQGEVVLEGTPGCDLDWEECTWQVERDAEGRRQLFIHLQKKDSRRGRWPATLLLEDAQKAQPNDS